MDEVETAIAQEIERWKSDTSVGAAWDARALIDRLSKAADGVRAISFGERALEEWPEFEPIHSAVAWAYYRKDISGTDIENPTSDARQSAKTALERIRALTSADPYGTYSAWPIAALGVARVAQARWPQAALEILDQIDPAHLDDSAKSDYPSNLARWHLGITRALEDLKRWSELLERCDAALAGSGLRAEDRRWIRRRRAFALQNVGRVKEAVAIFRELQRELSDWWAEADLANALHEAGENEEAREAALRALSKPGKLPMKWRTVMLVSELSQDDADLARQHAQLARALRGEEGWPADNSLEGLAARLGITGPAEKPDVRELRKVWQAASDPARSRGVVKALLPGERSGFITTATEDRDVYFAMPRDSTAPTPTPGTVVTFRLVAGFDKKKNQPSQRAVDVHPAE